MNTPPEFSQKRSTNRLPRLGDNLVRLQFQKSNGQFKITIPRGFAKSLRLNKGDVMEVFIERGDLVFRINELSQL